MLGAGKSARDGWDTSSSQVPPDSEGETDSNTIADTDIDTNTDMGDDPCAVCRSSHRLCVDREDGWVCGNCQENYYADDQGLCVQKLDDGQDCEVDAYAGVDCVSGYCVDGVCCDGACNGQCESCAVNDTFKGRCTPHLAGGDPDSDCEATEPSTCGQNGVCDGDGACQFWNDTTQCRPPSCVENSSSRPAAYCDGHGSCNDNADSVSCDPNSCDEETGTCHGGSCSNENPCADAYYCDSDACVYKLDNGTRCQSDEQCHSGDCTLDDFNDDGFLYCVPASDDYCALEGTAYPEAYTRCAPSGSTAYRTCDKDSWGDPQDCPNNAKYSCVAVGWSTLSGYKNPDSCIDNTSGHTCAPDQTCRRCSIKRTVSYALAGQSITTAQTSVYRAYGNGSCYTSCAVQGELDHARCAWTSTKTASHFCKVAEDTNVRPPLGLVGICLERLKSNTPCDENHQCQSNTCLKSNICS